LLPSLLDGGVLSTTASIVDSTAILLVTITAVLLPIITTTFITIVAITITYTTSPTAGNIVAEVSGLIERTSGAAEAGATKIAAEYAAEDLPLLIRPAYAVVHAVMIPDHAHAARR